MLQYNSIKEKSSSRFSLVLLICGLILFFISGYLRIPPFIVQLVALSCIVFSIQILQRYVLSDFSYVIDDSDDGKAVFSVIRTQGKKSTTVCSIDLVYCVYSGDSDKNTLHINNSFDYRQNVFSSDKYVLIYNESGDNVQIKLECDAAFKKALAQRIAQ